MAKNMQNARHLKNPKLEDKCMIVSPPKPYCHTFVSYFGFFGMSAIPCVWTWLYYQLLHTFSHDKVWLTKLNLC